MELSCFAKVFCQEMGELKALLRKMLPQGESGYEDLVYQHPDSAANLQLAGGASYTRDMTVNRRLMYLSIDAPEGVIISIYRDNSLWMFASNEIGAMEFKKGVYFGSLRIDVQNTTEVTQNWSIRFIFS